MISGLEFQPGPEENSDTGLVRIIRAELVEAGHILVVTDAAPGPARELADRQAAQPLRLDPDSSTSAPRPADHSAVTSFT